ncbi:hypothetical protein OEA41_005121 [Lepraria neglecta]|uniref:Trichothecene 3-O-acetyltransferase-like N-terminal domain-containing protein n=1 Tax=Lepraria neglecta TaxID=209136 RepID=A0AAE0DIV9_9LECA|nr:hypothetical protein OEA41_005121 [Lepraria neglecta]
MASDEIHIVLSPLNYVPPRNYVRLLFPLSLNPGVDEKVVFNDLREALHKTFVQEPWVSARDPAPSYPPDGPRPYQLKYQRLDTDWTYTDLRDAGFPSGIFDEQLLLDAPRVGDVDVGGAQIFVGQANFLEGGLLLGMTFVHAATDAMAMLNIQKLWAENFRELHERDAGGKIAPSRFTATDNDRTLPEKLWQRGTGGRGPSRNPDDPWLRGLACLDSNYPGDVDVTGATQRAAAAAAVATAKVNGHTTNGDDKPTTNGSHHSPRTMLNRVMFLSSEDLSALGKECALEPLPPGASPLSISDTINAIFWRDYLGNCFLLNTARMPLAKLVAPSTPLGRIAQALRQGAAGVDSGAVHDAHALLRSTPDLSRVQGRFVERPKSADLLLSNVIALPMSEIKFRGRYFGNGGTPHALRVLHGPYAPDVRLGHVLPRNPKHGGVELSVNLFEDEMVYLDADEEFGRYLVTIEA